MHTLAAAASSYSFVCERINKNNKKIVLIGFSGRVSTISIYIQELHASMTLIENNMEDNWWCSSIVFTKLIDIRLFWLKDMFTLEIGIKYNEGYVNWWDGFVGIMYLYNLTRKVTKWVFLYEKANSRKRFILVAWNLSNK